MVLKQLKAMMQGKKDSANWKKYKDSSFLARLDVPYVLNAHSLQTLDVFVPDTLLANGETGSTQHSIRYWIIYIHGGAWRDPRVTKSAFRPAIEHFISTEKGVVMMPHLAGFAAINYTLSSTSKYTSAPGGDRSLQGVHPDHIHDVIRSIAFLMDLAKKEGLPNDNYIIMGHSCGATLAFQVAMDHAIWVNEALPTIPKPEAVVGLAGLYDLLLLRQVKDPAYRHLEPVYREFLRGAFSGDESIWERVSPVSGSFGETWSDGKLAVLAQSHGDSLVSWEQTSAMKKTLENTWKVKQVRTNSTSTARMTEIIEITGDHDDVWRDGKELAEVAIKVLEALTKD